MPKISVIVPVYNVQMYLRQCLDSVLNQTFTDFEIICVNDGSTDDSGKILLEYADKDNRIKIITQENKGLSEARNSGLKSAQGEYIYFLDSDDFSHPQLLEICYTLAEKEQADLVSFETIKEKAGKVADFEQYDICGISYKKTHTPLFFQKKRGKYKISFNVWTKFYRKTLISDLFFIPDIYFEDYPYTYMVLSKYPRTVLLNIPLHHYVMNPVSISHSDFTVKKIQDYHRGLSFVMDCYWEASKKEKAFVRNHLFPSVLKAQLNAILKSSKDKQSQLYEAFKTELKDLDQKGWLSWRGHKLTRYLKYRKLISRGAL